MNDLSSAIETLYENRQKFIVIGLTGRTGSGCTSTAELLKQDIQTLKLPKPHIVNKNEERKYRIVYEFASSNWKPFHVIQVKDVITSFILENPFDKFLAYVTEKIEHENIESLLKKNIEEEYSKLHEERVFLKKLRKKMEKRNKVNKKKTEERREKSYKFYFEKLPPFTEKLKKILNDLAGDSYTSLYQVAGNNIRSSGNALDENFDSKNILRLAIRANKLIKIFTNLAKANKEEVYIVIDAIRNPFEAIFFRERYAAFYLMSINTDNNDRIYRLKKLLDLNDSQLASIDNNEYEKKLREAEVFYSQDISKCIELADIHINNPQKGENDFITLKRQLSCYIALIMHPGLITPSSTERCMQVAYTAKLNSACLSRQVGAAVADRNFSIKSIGWNNSPEGQPPCALRNIEHLIDNEDQEAYSHYEKYNKNFRDFVRNRYQDKIDSQEIRDKLCGRNISYCFKDLQNSLEEEKNQVHTRSLHAEENAFLQLAKYGGSGIQGGILFTTASPCELCSKKAYQLGIKRIIFIDPYPGIAKEHVLDIGATIPKLELFHGAIGRAFNQLFEPILPYKDELSFILNTEWPRHIVELAGSWKGAFPSAEELRSNNGKDFPREDL
ncbi:MAG: anti-phage dCTP deaminase [Candidatus Electrothrix sp. YB6]